MDSSFSFPQHPDHHPFERPVLPQSIWEFPTSRRLLLYQVAFGRCLDTGLAKVGSQPGPFGCHSSNWSKRVAWSKTTRPRSLTTTRTSTVSGLVRAAFMFSK
jgi:hypothetical protein